MNLPGNCDYIDIHTHESLPKGAGIFTVESLLANEDKSPVSVPGFLYTIGIHPWFLNVENHNRLMNKVIQTASHPLIIAIGESGFDKIRGPSPDLQRITFEEQVAVAEEHKKPVVIHCVRAWDALFNSHKRLKPEMPWLVHGYRGKPDMALQLISKGMYISIWFNFVMRPESAVLLRSLPRDRIFLETDGAGVDIRDIYNKVSADLGLTVEELKSNICRNFNEFFKLKEKYHDFGLAGTD